MRTCADHPLNDCATANDIIYCYCKDDLCNNQKAKIIREREQKKRKPEIAHIKTPPPTDDEDLEEASGLGEMVYPTETHGKKQLAPPPSSSAEHGSKKNYMITLKPATEALNLTTSSPIADAASSTNTQHTLSVFILSLANLIMMISFLRIN